MESLYWLSEMKTLDSDICYLMPALSYIVCNRINYERTERMMYIVPITKGKDKGKFRVDEKVFDTQAEALKYLYNFPLKGKKL